MMQVHHNKECLHFPVWPIPVPYQLPERIMKDQRPELINKKHMAQAFCQGSTTTFGGAQRAALTK
jgi:hypothetical protein